MTIKIFFELSSEICIPFQAWNILSIGSCPNYRCVIKKTNIFHFITKKITSNKINF